MGRIITFATGNIYKWSEEDNINELLDYIKPLDIDGVELTFAYIERLFKFELSNENIEYLQSLEYNTIHAPFNMTTGAKDINEIYKQLDYIKELYDKINAHNVIIHPRVVPGPVMLGKYDMKCSTENMPPKHVVPLPELKSIMRENPDMGFCLDVTHAYQISPLESQIYYHEFKERITQFHLSGSKDGRGHLQLKPCKADFFRSLDPIHNSDVPIVIEEIFDEKNLDLLKEEIEYVRYMF
ncbi:sugar phosphate isomerase/epimerase family protein [Nanoarchaeota archaeon]